MNFRDLLTKRNLILAGGGIAIGGGALLMFGGGSVSRRTPNLNWTYPKNAADKLQYILDLTQLAFDKQGTVYINSGQEWDNARQAIVIERSLAKTKRSVAWPVGWTCSRLVGALGSYWLNAGSNFDNLLGYSCDYAVKSSYAGDERSTSWGSHAFRGFAEYATKVIPKAFSYGEVYDRWDELGQLNIAIRNTQGSGHCFLLAKCDKNFRLRDPESRLIYGDKIIRIAADGSRPNKVYSANRTSVKPVEPGDIEGNKHGFEVWSLKLGDNNNRCRVTTGPYEDNPTYPLLLQGQNT
jgi:hypothetical protein